MTSAMLTERSGFCATTANWPGSTAAVAPVPAASTGCFVPRCQIDCEQCADGCKIRCACDDDVSCRTLQNLCRALAGGACCVACTWNGVTICQCNFTCCHCRCETTSDGVCISCTCGDKACCTMVKSLCECIRNCIECGCCCTVCFGNTPVCCAC